MSMTYRNEDITGRVYGRLTAQRRLGIRGRWDCVCNCGNIAITTKNKLETGHTKSCGCLKSHAPKGERGLKAVYYSYKHVAKSNKRVFELSVEDVRFLTQQRCHYCDRIPQQRAVLGRGRGDYVYRTSAYVYNGIDRVDSSRGYVLDNVVPCCKACNIAKHNSSYEQFKQWVKAIHTHWGSK
jgi:hypothetical protein